MVEVRDGKRIAWLADHGAVERWQHSGRVLEETDQAGVLAARVLEEHGLDRLVLARVIDGVMRDAGLRLRADYQVARMESRVTASYNASRGTRQGGYVEYERGDVEEAAYQRWRKAVHALGKDSGLVLAVCCYDLMPRAANLPQLRRGLARLAAIYGITP